MIRRVRQGLCLPDIYNIYIYIRIIIYYILVIVIIYIIKYNLN